MPTNVTYLWSSTAPKKKKTGHSYIYQTSTLLSKYIDKLLNESQSSSYYKE
jgi:hypothetical protein